MDRASIVRRIKSFIVMLPKLIAEFLEQANVQASRSTVLQPLRALVGICAAGLLAAIYIKAPSWVTILFASSLGLSVLLFLGAYTYCLFKDRDALRSEKYSIQKLAIERGFVGDSLSGIFRPSGGDEGGTQLIPDPEK